MPGVKCKVFWYLVQKTKNKNVYKCPIKLSTGETITNAEDIREAWSSYFQNLYSVGEDEKYDERHRNKVREDLVDMTIDSYSVDEKLLSELSESEIGNIVSDLAVRKAPGVDGVTNEHLRFGGTKMVKYLTKLLSLIVQYEYIPRCFKIGIIVPIPKGDKDRCKQDNYRGITLMPVIAKV